MGIRSWPRRRKFLLPLVSGVVLWTVVITVAVRATSGPTTAQTYREHAKLPALELVTQLQQERRLSLVYLGGGRSDSVHLAEQRTRTDAAVATFQRLAYAKELAEVSTDLVDRRLRELSTALEMLATARETIDRGELDRAGAVHLYTRMTDAAYRLLLPLADLDDRELARHARAVVALGRARDMLAQEDALLAGVAAAGRMTAADHSQLVQAIGMQRARYADAIAELPESDRVACQNLVKSEAAVRLRALEDRVVAKGQSSRTLPVDVTQWGIAYDVVAGQLRDIELTADTAVAERAVRAAGGPHTGLWLAGTLILVLVALGFALWLGRSRGPRAGRLRDAAEYLARGRLRGVLRRVRGEGDTHAGAGSPRRDGGAPGYASQEVRRATRQPALSEVWLQQGLYEVFLAMALRSQELLHRQLALLDGMERRFTEPADLAEVFRVDHLATRMRRHVEDAITLADAVPGRGWRKPVPMIDVIRGAVSEVEDYTRVTTLAVANVGLVGRAVGDTIHLLAELIENGTSFSPPDARVEVSGCLVPNGFVIEVEDRGVGMATEALAEANQRLAEPTSFDPAVSPCLGLYVVARLARRHGIGVRLRPSPYGGISAVVLVPPDLVAVGLDVSLAELAPAASASSASGAERVVELGPTDVTTVDQPARPGSPLPVRGGPALLPKPADERIVAAEPMDEPVVAVGTTTGGLPRRIPQASLAAQLRDAEPAIGEPAQAGPAGARTAERTRARLSAFQKGTARGRERLPATGAVPSQVPALSDESATDAGRPQE